MTPVPPERSAKARPRVILVGEAPGRIEEAQGRPFMGRTGVFLTSLLREAKGPKREECHLTNAALCRGEGDEENAAAAECCAPRLLRELTEFSPVVPIVALGKLATKSILGKGNIMRARGFIFKAPKVEASKIRAAEKTLAKPVAKGKKRKLTTFLKPETLKLRAQ